MGESRYQIDDGVQSLSGADTLYAMRKEFDKRVQRAARQPYYAHLRLVRFDGNGSTTTVVETYTRYGRDPASEELFPDLIIEDGP